MSRLRTVVDMFVAGLHGSCTVLVMSACLSFYFRM